MSAMAEREPPSADDTFGQMAPAASPLITLERSAYFITDCNKIIEVDTCFLAGGYSDNDC